MPRKHTETYDHVLKFIVSYKTAHDGNSPTVREIADGCGISSTSMVVYALVTLERAGKIKLPRTSKGASRQIIVTGGKWSYSQKGAAHAAA